MKYENAVYPSKDQLAELAESSADRPIYMVNLVKYKTKAEYADGRDTELTGEEAYGLYIEGVRGLLAKVGGELTFSAPVTGLRLGEVEELWDSVSIAMYPARQAMLEMMMMPEMSEISEHRAAGLKGQLNIEASGAEGSWLDNK